MSENIPRKEEMRQTVSIKGQYVLTKLVDVVSLYNIDITNQMVQKNVVEYAGGSYSSVFERLEVPEPCPLQAFVNATCRFIEDEYDEIMFRHYLDCDRLIEAYNDGKYEQSAEYEIILADGIVHTIRHKMILTKDEDTGDIIARCSTRDINEIVSKERDSVKKQERIEIYEAERRSMNLIYEVIRAGFYSINYDDNGDIAETLWSDVLRGMLGYESEEDFPNEIESCTDLLHGEDRDAVVKLLDKAAKDKTGKTNFDIEFRLFTRNQGYKWFLGSGRINRRPDGSPISMVGLLKDIDESKKVEEKMAEQLEIVKALSRDFLNVYKVNVELRTAEAIKIEGYQIKGVKSDAGQVYPYDALLRQYVRERVYPEDQATMLEMLALDVVTTQLKKKKTYSSGYRIIENGEIHYFQFMYLKMPNTDYIIAGFKNVDEIVEAAKERESLLVLSETDMMTGLLNRGSGESKASMLLDKRKSGMLCILDIDNFKTINDSYGHAVGDKVIISVAKCLKDAFRERDIVFRLGGDEFAVYAVGDIEEDNARKIFDRFFGKISKIEIPEIGDRKITTSVGAILVGEDNKRSFEELYKAADRCVYISKKTSGNALNIC